MTNDTTQMNKGSTISWLALIVAIAALVVGWLAYNRSGTNLLAQIEESAQRTVTETNLRFARLEAATRLVALRASQVANPNFNQLETELVDIRADLRQEYVDAGLSESQSWTTLQNRFNQVQQNIENRSANLLISLDQLTTDLRGELNLGNNDSQ